MDTTPVYGIPYPEPTDAITDYPAVAQEAAETIESAIAAVPSDFKKLWDTSDAGVVFPIVGITTPALDQSYTHLLVTGRTKLASASGSGYLGVRFNGDTGNNYSNDRVYGGRTTAPAAAGGGLNSYMNMAWAGNADVFDFSFEISNYSEVSKKFARGLGIYPGSYIAMFGGEWSPAVVAALSTMTFFDPGGVALTAATRITVYGRN